ncbi:hypothetical protein QJQ45_028507 [Haematococcus lacustris]|nr:hypothetical protein QJQ45_028507 [Haematococcus lacustris]
MTDENKAFIDNAASTSYQKLIEQKEKEVQQAIVANYSRLKDVQHQLLAVQQQLQVNVGPRKHALEMLRLKIEQQTERVALARQRHSAARQVMLACEADLAREEAQKEQLCNELNVLVQQSATAHMAKLEELQNQLAMMTRGVPPTSPRDSSASLPVTHPPPASPASTDPVHAPSSLSASSQQGDGVPPTPLPEAGDPADVAAAKTQRQERQKAAAAARARHVSISGPGGTRAQRTGRDVENGATPRTEPGSLPLASGRQHDAQPLESQHPQHHQQRQTQGFAGFDV